MKLPTIQKKGFTLRQIRMEDEEALARNINNKKIYQNTLRIPYPYTRKDAREWIQKTQAQRRKKDPESVSFVIDRDGEVVGGIGLDRIRGHKAEIGYWLAEKEWRRGIMTTAVKEMTRFAFKELRLRRLEAYVFPWNNPSRKVLQKAGYTEEGYMKKYAKKGDKLIDAWLYAKVQ